MNITVIIPSRKRVLDISAALTSLNTLASGKHNIQYIVGCDDDKLAINLCAMIQRDQPNNSSYTASRGRNLLWPFPFAGALRLVGAPCRSWAAPTTRFITRFQNFGLTTAAVRFDTTLQKRGQFIEWWGPQVKSIGAMRQRHEHEPR